MKTKNNRKPNAGDTWAAPEVKRSPTRFRNPIGKYKIMRGPKCNASANARICARKACIKSGAKMAKPRDFHCLGVCCRNNDFYCIDKCPAKALRLVENPLCETLGDYRWPANCSSAPGTWRRPERFRARILITAPVKAMAGSTKSALISPTKCLSRKSLTKRFQRKLS